MPWMTNFCTPRLASPGLTVNPLLNSAGGCYTAPDGGPTVYLSAYDLANSRRSKTRAAVGSTYGANAVNRATMGALFNAPVVGPAISGRSLGTLGDIVGDMCQQGTRSDVNTVMAFANVGIGLAQAAVGAACQTNDPKDNTCRDLRDGFRQAGTVSTTLQQGYNNLCAATQPQQSTPAVPAIDYSRFTRTSFPTTQPPQPRYSPPAAPGMSTGAKVGIGVGVGLAAMAAFSFFR